MRLFVASMILSPMGQPVFETLSILNTVVVAMEPDTMRPHYYHTEKRVEASVRVDGAGPLDMTQVDERTTTYRYEP